ncbi:MAG: MOP flippase family protein [Syntrophothermus sp.]|jgi:PST family polysaccharide transporter
MELGRNVVRGVKWSFISQFGRQIFQFLTTAVLARLLSPKDIGLVGMALIVTGFLNIFRDLGTSAAIIQKKETSAKFLNSIYLINITFGICATVLVYFSAPLISTWIFNEKRIAPILSALAFTFLLSSFGLINQALLEKKLDFNKVAKVEVTATFLGSLSGIVTAIWGFGVWSLVIQTLVTAGVSSFLYVIVSGWYPGFRIDLREIKDIFRFSANLTGFSVLNYFVRTADNFLIGRYLGAESLGYYTFAYRLMLYPLQNISSVISRVAFPFYSHIQNDNKKISSTYLKIAVSIAIVTFPLMLGLMALSHEFVLTFFGGKWSNSIMVIVILAPVGLMQSIDSTTGSIYQSKGKTDWLFYWGIFSGVIFVLSFVIGLYWGINGVAFAYLIANLILLYPGFEIPFKLIGLRFISLLSKLSKTFLLSVVMSLVIILFKYTVGQQLSVQWSLVFSVILGVASYGFISWFMNRDNLHYAVKLLKGTQG